MSLESSPASRRRFLIRSARVAAGLCGASTIVHLQPLAAAPRPLPAAEAAGSKPKMRFGFTTYQWGRDWDIPALIANCEKAGTFGVELRTSSSYAHGVELEISAERRQEVKKRFAGSPVALVGIASGERFDDVDPEAVKAAIEKAKGYVKLSHDVGSSGVRVFPNAFHKEVPREQTIAQIAKALNAVGAYAADLGQQVRLEAHGSAGDLPTIRAIMEQVAQRSVRVKLNSDKRDAEGKGFEHNFNLVKDYLGDTVHAHDLEDPSFPNQLQIDLLRKMGWTGWVLLEASAKVPDRVQALREQRELWEKMVASSGK
jgi:hypothetical protein